MIPNNQTADGAIPIFLHGNNFDSNRGCQALRLTTEAILARFLPELTPVHANIFYNDNPMFADSERVPCPKQLYEIKRERNLAFYLWGTNIVGCRLWGFPTPMKIIRETGRLRKENRPGALLALGGDNWSFDYGRLALHLFTEPFRAAVKQGFPTVVWGASIGPFSSSSRWERKMASLLRRIDLITSRESLTREYLRSLGVEENVRDVCDPAFLLPTNEPKNLPDELRRVLERGAVGINLAPLLGRYVRQSEGTWEKTLREVFENFAARVDAPIVLIPHVMMEPEVFPNNDDFLFMRKMREKLPETLKSRTFLYDSRQDDSTEIKWVISRLRAFAGCRTHATIAALSSGVPTFCIGYSVKSRGINQDLFGHTRWCDHFSNLLGDRLGVRFAEMMEKADELRTHLTAQMPVVKEKALQGGVFLREMLVRKGVLK